VYPGCTNDLHNSLLQQDICKKRRLYGCRPDQQSRVILVVVVTSTVAYYFKIFITQKRFYAFEP